MLNYESKESSFKEKNVFFHVMSFRLRCACHRFFKDLASTERILFRKFTNIECLDVRHFKNSGMRQDFLNSLMEDAFRKVWNESIQKNTQGSAFVQNLFFEKKTENFKILVSRKFALPKKYTTKIKRRSPKHISLFC